MSQQGHIDHPFRGKRADSSSTHQEQLHRLREHLRDLSVEPRTENSSSKESSKLDSLLQEIKTLAANADDTERVNVLSKLRDVSHSIESPDDTIKRMLYSYLSNAVVRTCQDLKLFEILAEAKEPLTTDQLAETTGASTALLGRLLRYLASLAIINETAANTYSATNITSAIAIPGYAAGMRLMFDFMGPVFQNMPSYFKSNAYADVTDHTRTPNSQTFATDLPMFQWLQTRPDFLEPFNALMKAWSLNERSWLDVYPAKEACRDRSPDTPLFLDLGGGLGHQAIRFQKRFPQLEGRIVVQDLQAALVASAKHEGIDFMQYDFFTPQPLKGAKFYYFRNCLHDWSDAKCRLILQNVKDAMGPHSLLLVDEMVLPDTGAHFHQTQMDVIMMINLAAKERTEKQWYALLSTVGLTVNRIYTYDASVRHAVIEAALPQRARRISNL